MPNPIEKKTANNRTALLLIAASAMSFGLVYGGHWLVYLYTVKKELDNPSSFITAFLFAFFLTLPLTAIGIFIGYFEQRRRWWMSGIALVPLLTVLLYNSFHTSVLVFCFVYLFLSLLADLMVSRSKKSVQTL